MCERFYFFHGKLENPKEHFSRDFADQMQPYQAIVPNLFFHSASALLTACDFAYASFFLLLFPVATLLNFHSWWKCFRGLSTFQDSTLLLILTLVPVLITFVLRAKAQV
jgi:hypothetical protein